jgi:small-conductance mechanosensitive channel
MSNEKIFDAFEKTISSSSFYLQSVSLIACFLLSYFFYQITKKIFLTKSVAIRKNVELERIAKKYLYPLLYPLFSIVFLSIGLSIYEKFFKETILFSTTIKLITIFLFLMFVRISSNNNFIANTIGMILVPALILDIFNLLDPTTIYLDQYALKLGSIRISVYLVIKSLIVLMILFWLASLISSKSKSYLSKSKNIKLSTKNIISKFIDILIYFVVFIITLKTVGVDMTAFAVIGGAVGVGIGFGLQKIASNFISGLVLLFEKSIEVGDWVELDNGNIFGIVKHFGGRYTLIESFDGKEIMVPNEDFIVGKVTNWTYSNKHARIEIDVRVSYDSDLKKAKQIMIQCAQEYPRLLRNLEIECYLTKLDDFDVKIVLYFWIIDIIEGRMLAKSDVLLNILEKFKQNDIKIPFPKREIYFVSEQQLTS